MGEDHIVSQGESVSSIAYEHGFFWQTLWDHPKNRDLKSLRKDPDILTEGDVLHIPDREDKQESGATEGKHSFKMRGVPAKFVLIVLQDAKDQAGAAADDEGSSNWWEYQEPKPKAVKREPMAHAPFELFADGVLVKKDQTDGDGRLEAKLVPNARAGLLVLNRGTARESVIELNFRCMDADSSLSGISRRLNNLGFPCRTEAPEPDSETQAALQAFQEQHGLDVSGKVDDATRNRLKEVYGG